MWRFKQLIVNTDDVIQQQHGECGVEIKPFNYLSPESTTHICFC